MIQSVPFCLLIVLVILVYKYTNKRIGYTHICIQIYIYVHIYRHTEIMCIHLMLGGVVGLRLQGCWLQAVCMRVRLRNEPDRKGLVKLVSQKTQGTWSVD